MAVHVYHVTSSQRDNPILGIFPSKASPNKGIPEERMYIEQYECLEAVLLAVSKLLRTNKNGSRIWTGTRAGLTLVKNYVLMTVFNYREKHFHGGYKPPLIRAP